MRALTHRRFSLLFLNLPYPVEMRYKPERALTLFGILRHDNLCYSVEMRHKPERALTRISALLYTNLASSRNEVLAREGNNM